MSKGSIGAGMIDGWTDVKARQDKAASSGLRWMQSVCRPFARAWAETLQCHGKDWVCVCACVQDWASGTSDAARRASRRALRPLARCEAVRVRSGVDIYAGVEMGGSGVAPDSIRARWLGPAGKATSEALPLSARGCSVRRSRE